MICMYLKEGGGCFGGGIGLEWDGMDVFEVDVRCTCDELFANPTVRLICASSDLRLLRAEDGESAACSSPSVGLCEGPGFGCCCCR